jgi:RNA polymerase sigma-70 factor (ECF subfamily)
VTVSFEDVLTQNRDRIFNLLFRLTGDFHTAEDLFQETFLKVYRNLHGFNGISGVSTWVYAIAFNVFRDHVRKRKWALLPSENIGKSSYDTEGDETFSPEYDFLRKEESTRLQKILNEVKTNLKVPTVLHYLEGLSIRDIAQITGRTQTDIRVSLHRARKFLRRRWEAIT